MFLEVEHGGGHMSSHNLAFLWILDTLFLLGLLGTVIGILAQIKEHGVLAGAVAFLKSGTGLCFALAIIGAVCYGLNPQILLYRYTHTFANIELSPKRAHLTNELDRLQPRQTSSKVQVVKIYKKGSNFYGKIMDGAADLHTDATKTAAIFTSMNATAFKFSSTCTLDGATRCDLVPVTKLPQGKSISLFEQHISVCPAPGAAQATTYLDVYDPNKHVVTVDAEATASMSASELGKVCRLLLPANLPTGKGMLGEDTSVDNILRSGVCAVSDLAGTVLGEKAGMQQTTTPTQEHLNMVKQKYSYYYK